MTKRKQTDRDVLVKTLRELQRMGRNCQSSFDSNTGFTTLHIGRGDLLRAIHCIERQLESKP